MADRKMPDDYRAMAEERGAVWLGPEVPNANTRTRWRCVACACEWWAVYNTLQGGSACPACGIRKRSETQRAKPADYHALAGERGFVWTGPPVRSAGARTGWRCAHGHEWSARFTKIRRGGGCPTCARQAHATRACALRHTPERYQALASSCGMVWLGPAVARANDRTRWQCKACGHRWWATYNKINHGRGCPPCSVVRRSTAQRRKPAEYHALARSRRFEWIGPPVSSATADTRWRCAKGHEWTTSYVCVRMGSGCHVCGQRVNGKPVSQPQRTLARRIGGELNHPFGRRRIDVVVVREGVRIAVEYDAWYFHGGQQHADLERDRELIAAGWRVLRVRSAYLVPSRHALEAALARVVAGETRVEITLADWGVGPCRNGAWDPNPLRAFRRGRR